MPITGDTVSIHEYLMSSAGVNLRVAKNELAARECILSKNLLWRDGMIARTGYSKLDSEEVSSGNAITGLRKFYFGVNNAQLMVASGIHIKYHDGSTWQTIDNTRTAGNDTIFTPWGALDFMYVANSVDNPFYWDGTNKINLSGSGFPSQAIQFLVYQDRLLYLDAANPGSLGWSKSFKEDTWETLSDVGINPDSYLYGMIVHSSANENFGLESRVLLAGQSGMYLLSGSDLRTPSTTGDYKIESLAIPVGCNAPRTMTWTPVGTAFLAMDKQVYMLGFGSQTPIPISYKIQSQMSAIPGLESIPTTSLDKSCAVYHDGFYKLCVPKSGSTFNNVQWWLDISRLQKDGNGLWGPWFGPMEGGSFSVLANLDGPGDGGTLVGGEGDSSIGSLVYDVNTSGLYTDDGSDIDITYQTLFNGLSNVALLKTVNEIEMEVLSGDGTITFTFQDTTRDTGVTRTVSISSPAVFYGDVFYGDEFYSGLVPQRKRIPITPPLQVRLLSLVIKSSINEDFKLSALRVEELEGSRTFEDKE